MKKQKYWLSLEQWSKDQSFQTLAQTASVQKDKGREFMHPLPTEKEAEGLWERREFLQLMAASMALASFGCVRRPAEKIVPYIRRPEDVQLGKDTLYSSSYYDGEEGFGLVVKTREGRPIKIEGNKDHPVNQGGLSARAHSHLLSLYDPERLKQAQKNLFNKEKTNREKIRIDYSKADSEIADQLKKGKTAFLTGEWPSPSSEKLLRSFCKTSSCSHFVWNPLNHSAITTAQKLCYGEALLPRFCMDRARLIISINCDFLGTWLSPTEFNRLYSQGRKANRDMNRLVVFESLMSLTGTNADMRVRIKPSQQLDLVLSLAHSLKEKGFVQKLWPAFLKPPAPAPWKRFHIEKENWDQLIKDLWEQRGQSLILAGDAGKGYNHKGAKEVSKTPHLQIAVAWLNHLLGNDGWTVDYKNGYRTWTWANRDVEQLISHLEKGKIKNLIIHKTNPLYTYPDKKRFLSALKKADMVVYTGDREDETGQMAHYILPDSHNLEKWSDWEFQKGVLSVQQPVIRPLYNSRAFEDGLIQWAFLMGESQGRRIAGETKTWYEYLRKNATVIPPLVNNPRRGGTASLTYQQASSLKESQSTVIPPLVNNPRRGGTASLTYQQASSLKESQSTVIPPLVNNPRSGWEQFLERGVWVKNSAQRKTRFPIRNFRSSALSSLKKVWLASDNSSMKNKELLLYPTVGLKEGSLANVSWLQEFPDPVTKICWDNYLCVSPGDARRSQLKEGQVVQLYSAKREVASKGSQTPAEKGTASPAEGGSQTLADQASLKVPVHIQPGQADGTLGLALGYGRERAGKIANQVGVNAWPLAFSQKGQVGLSSFVHIRPTLKKVSLANTQGHHSMEGRQIVVETTLKKYLKNPGGAIHRHKVFSLWSSHQYPKHKWGMVIDLNSCTGCSACVIACQAENNIPTVGKDLVLQGREMHWIRVDRYYKGTPEKPETLHQPVVCMHCDNAPCETVCPVTATVHSDEGTNDMIYNRCVGTRYCANNCPYKVRRFNWFNYAKKVEKPLNMAMNPDVTVRSRGVMEKCTFCVHRIRSAQAKAKLENRELKDGDVQTACQQSCPAKAIVFGDLKDKSSEVYRLFNREDSYSLLEELNTRPAVRYQVKVRNKEDSGKDDPHHG